MDLDLEAEAEAEADEPEPEPDLGLTLGVKIWGEIFLFYSSRRLGVTSLERSSCFILQEDLG